MLKPSVACATRLIKYGPTNLRTTKWHTLSWRLYLGVSDLPLFNVECRRSLCAGICHWRWNKSIGDGNWFLTMVSLTRFSHMTSLMVAGSYNLRGSPRVSSTPIAAHQIPFIQVGYQQFPRASARMINHSSLFLWLNQSATVAHSYSLLQLLH